MARIYRRVAHVRGTNSIRPVSGKNAADNRKRLRSAVIGMDYRGVRINLNHINKVQRSRDNVTDTSRFPVFNAAKQKEAYGFDKNGNPRILHNKWALRYDTTGKTRYVRFIGSRPKATTGRGGN